MPDPGSLNTLARRLREAMGLHTGHREAGWAPPSHPMRQALKDVRKVFGGDDDPNRPPRDDMVAAVRKFLRQRQVESFTQLKYVCYGVTVPFDDDGERLIDRSTLFQQLLDLVQSRQAQAKQFRRCYQGLLAAYFGFEHASGATAAAGQNWLKLRGYLDDRLEPVATAARNRGRSPEWLDVLVAHRNLLTDKPCERYAQALRAGNRAELEGVCAGLDISPTSWVWHEAVMAYVHEVVRADDQPFQTELLQVLKVVDGDQHGHQLPALVARDAVALSVARYSLCADKPEHPALRDACLRRVGNPWLERPAWDASVKSEPARQMVESWLKRRLIKDFFELLAHDGSADVRRLNYWLKWEPQISDMWFVLGWNAHSSRLPAFVALKERMKGRDRVLEGASQDSNNAFVMRIGDHFVIEFGQTNNACFVFPVGNSTLDLDKKKQNIYLLKNQPGREKLTHGWQWESKFDHRLRELLNAYLPEAKPRLPPSAPELSAGPIAQTSPPRVDVPRQDQGALLKSLIAKQTDSVPQVKSIWPAYTPPKSSTEPARGSTSVTDYIADNYPKNPRTLGLGQLEALRFRCRRYGVELEEGASGRARSWVHLRKPESAPDVAALATELGFTHVPGKGYYIDRPERAATDSLPNDERVTVNKVPGLPHAPAIASQLGLLKKLCEVDGVAFEDNTAKGGAVWVRLIGLPASTSLIAMMKRLGFRHAPGKGYYLNLLD